MAQVGFLMWTMLLCILGAPMVLQHFVMEPSCSSRGGEKENDGSSSSLRVVVVADLHLAGPRTAWVDRVRREAFMQSTFQKAYRKLKPDALVVLGDVSDAGRRSNDAQWEAVVARFWSLVRPFASTPMQVVVGNHDVGDHHDPGFAGRLPRFAASFPGLDATCGSRFQWKGIDFVSLNAMAMHGDGCSVCSSVEKIVESTSSALHEHHEKRGHDTVQQGDARNDGDMLANVGGSPRPVLLLHLPLYRRDDYACASLDTPRCAPWHDLEGNCRGVASSPSLVLPLEEPHRVGQDVLSYKSSVHLLQSLKPRLVLSGHTHRWCDRIHSDGTREITVPSLSWRNRDDPSLVLATFHANSSVTIQRCMLAHESTVLAFYVIWGVAVVSWLLAIAFMAFNRLRVKSVKPE